MNFKNSIFKVFKLSFLIAIAFLFSSNISAQERNRIIESVDIQGNRRIADEEILTYMQTRSSQTFNEKQLQKDLENLLKLGWLNSTHTKVLTEPGIKGGLNVIFEVRELPLVEEVEFEGLRNFTKKDIVEALQTQELNVKKGDVYNPSKIRNASTFLKNFLVERGFFDLQVQVWEEEISATSVKIKFVIEEQRPENQQLFLNFQSKISRQKAVYNLYFPN